MMACMKKVEIIYATLLYTHVYTYFFVKNIMAQARKLLLVCII